MTLIIIFILLISLTFERDITQNNIIDFSPFDKRILSTPIENCETYDRNFKDVCIKCFNNLILPDCQRCPIGYRRTGKQNLVTCSSCNYGQVFCDDLKTPQCFNGFQQNPITNECSCSLPSAIRYEWCTNDSEFYYYSFYKDAEILSKFSAEIIFEIGDQNTWYQYNSANCGVLSNIYAYKDINEPTTLITCRIDPELKNIFAISLKNFKASSTYTKIVPTFDNTKISMKANLNRTTQPKIIYQNTSQNSPQETYHDNNQSPQNQCKFKPGRFLFFPGINIIPKEYFVLKGFKQSNIEVIQTSGSQNTYNQNSIQNGLNMYPKDMQIDISNNPFDLKQIVKFAIKCELPFGLSSFSGTDIEYQLATYNIKYVVIIKNEISPSDLFLLSIDMTKNSQTIWYEYLIKIQVVDSITKQEVFSSPQIAYDIIQDGSLFQYKIDPYTFVAGSYDLIIYRKYILDQNNPFEVHSFKVSPSKFYCKISSGDLQNQNPLETIKIVGDIISTEYKDINDYLYKWSCVNDLTQQNCDLNTFLAPIFLSQKEINIPSKYFDFSASYTIILIASLISKPEINSQTKISIKTVEQMPLIAQYSKKYDEIGISYDELLTLNLFYQDLSLLKKNNYFHQFELQTPSYEIMKSDIQDEPQFYFSLNKFLKTNEKLKLQIRFFVFDSDMKTILMSKRYYFTTRQSPFDCQVNAELTGKEKSFIDQIKVNVSNCKSQNGGDLNYAFYIVHHDNFKNEFKNPNYYLGIYLTKFQKSNEIITYLSTGTFQFSVIVKDNLETKAIFSKNITITKGDLTREQYIKFVQQQYQKSIDFRDKQQYDEELCTLGFIIECIEEYEYLHAQPQEIIQIKDELKQRLMKLPFLISNDLQSQQLQEFIMRCIQKLYQKINVPITFSLNELQSIIIKKREELQTLDPFPQEVKDTYKRQMLIALEITSQQIKEINKTEQDLTIWNIQQIQSFQNIQDCLAFTLNQNQRIVWNDESVSILVHKVDSQLLTKYYLLNSEKEYQDSLENEYDQRLSYFTKSQYWKENIYAKEKKFLNQMVTQTNSQEISQKINTVFPAYNYDIQMWYDVPVYKNRLLNIKKQQNLILPLNSNIKYQFLREKNDKFVVCTQKNNEIWSTSECKTIIEQKDNQSIITCSCPKPSYTTLIYDIKALLENDNLSNIFSEQGINDIFSLDDWYQYVALYVIIVLNISFIGTLLVAKKIDKKELLRISNRNLQSIAFFQPKQKLSQSGKNFNQISQQSNNDMKTQNKLQESFALSNRSDQKADKEFKDIKTQKEFLESQEITEHQESLKRMNEQKIVTGSEQNTRKQSLNSNPDNEDDKNIQVLDQNTVTRKSFIESGNKVVHMNSIILQMNTNETPKEREKKLEKAKQIQQNKLLKEKCQQYLSDISKLRGILHFHLFLQTFLVYDKKQSRAFRLSVYYSKLVWLLAINAVFGKDITISQVIILSVICSLTFFVYKTLFSLLFKRKMGKYFSYLICFLFLLFCYYSIFVSISTSSTYDANVWILCYFYTLITNTLFLGFISATIKYVLTQKLIKSLSPDSIIFQLIGTEIIFQMFQ